MAPKARYVSGKSSSAAGLTASVVKDEFVRGWSLEAGALVLANKGIALIDELDKMSAEDRSALHEGLESQTITISKANIQATLNSQTSVSLRLTLSLAGLTRSSLLLNKLIFHQLY